MGRVPIVRTAPAQLQLQDQIRFATELSFETGCRSEFRLLFEMGSQYIRGSVFENGPEPDLKRKLPQFSGPIGLAPDLIMAGIYFLGGVGVIFKIPKSI